MKTEDQPVATGSIGAGPIAAPAALGSYDRDDVVFLLKDLTGLMQETALLEREQAIQGGRHYSEMLPVEYRPSPAYRQLFFTTLRETARQVALAVAVTAELIYRSKGGQVVLVSLARAGTPVGILIKRYLKAIYGAESPHYSISIIRDIGIDQNAILYILQNHAGRPLQFVDGWTGKGTITQVLQQACADFNAKYDCRLPDDLAVLADPGCCAGIFGTREDFLIPSACLNATVSGLISRTVYRPDLIGERDFHGVKIYRELSADDVSNLFVDTVAAHFWAVQKEAKALAAADDRPGQVTWQGAKDIRRIQTVFGITDPNLIKPGVGETTRVLLRRLPWRVLVNSRTNPALAHVLLLAAERGVAVEEFPGISYSCCGIIRPLREGAGHIRE